MRSIGPARDVVVVGRSCRLPGASSVDALWANLLAGRCDVTTVPADRWSRSKHGHPRPREPGKSYVWAAGVLDDIWAFDPTVFGISPREAEQMDPQQRLMLELTWEALEDAGITRSALAGTDVGVFVGASSTEYQTLRHADMASVDAYTATGGALSIISNRISHTFDLKGPSFTVDTACSSSLVALHQAMEALRTGRIDTAIVGGVNLLLSPFGFVIFSQASMLSPTGLCRSFDAKGDGYVRSEGGVVLVLKTANRAARDGNHVHARLVASGVNSDGRTNGIALPSRFSQAKLLREVYKGARIDPSQVAFIEAHGTGTRVGDPIEAHTIGEALGRDRATPLLIGSIKSNIGHLEPASGLAGVLKAMLAFEHDILPPSVNYDEPNPEIPFEELGLSVCAKPTPLPSDDRPRYAGINSFGFGGTNAHVVISDPAPRPVRSQRAAGNGNADLFTISAASRPVVRDLARRYSQTLASASFEDAREIVAAAAHRRELLSERAVVQWSSPRDLVRKLERIADKADDLPDVTWGTASEPNAGVAFVFSGNGSQWPGMGRDAYGTSRRFREAFDEVDTLFDREFGWSVTEALFSNDIEQRLRFTHIAQPLIFSVQIAVARALQAEGLEPVMVLGHSVGEIAAATVAGALSLRDGVRVIQARSSHQEAVHDAGRMAVLVGGLEQVQALCREIGDVEVAAENSPRTFTVAGPTERIAALGALARRRRLVFRQLDLDYPFHCGLMEPVRDPLLRDLAGLKHKATRIDLVSTVTGDVVTAGDLGPDYWWRNVRDPVRFSAAVATAARRGARIFVEVGPRSVLLSQIRETLEASAYPGAAIGVLESRTEHQDGDPIRPAVLSAFALGAPIELEKLFGPEPTRPIRLPSYPWHRRDLRAAETPEAVGSTSDTRWHRLAGARVTADSPEWLGLLDTSALPELADHEVGGQPILPGAAFAEIALTVAREWFGKPDAAVLELDIVQALPLEAQRAKELKVRFSPVTSTLEILSRPRLSRAGWHLHAMARLSVGTGEPIRGRLPEPAAGDATISAQEIYAAAEAVGLRYGPAFRLISSVSRPSPDRFVLDLLPSATDPSYGIDPARLDACFHGLFALFDSLGADQRGMAYIPVRFGHTRLARPGASPARAMIEITRAGESAIVADFTLFDEAGEPIAELQDARFQAARVRRMPSLGETALVARAIRLDQGALGRSGLEAAPDALRSAAVACAAAREPGGDTERALLDGWAEAAAFDAARALAPDGWLATERLEELEPRVATWMRHLLGTLAQNGLVEESEAGWQLAAEPNLPPADAVLRTLAAEHPERSAELLLAGRLTGLADGAGNLASLPLPSSGNADGLELGGVLARDIADGMLDLLDRAGTLDVGGLRILQVGFGPLSHALAERSDRAESRLTILDLDPRRLERAKLGVVGSMVTFAATLGDLPASGFDLVVSADGLRGLERGGAALADLRRLTAAGGVLVAAEAPPSLFWDAVLGLSENWFSAGTATLPLSPLRSDREWRSELQASGFADTSATELPLSSDTVTLMIGGVPRPSAEEPVPRSILVQGHAAAADELGLAERLDALLALDGHDVRLFGRDAGATVQAGETVLYVGLSEDESDGDDVARLRDGCLAIKGCADLCAGQKAELWVVIPSGRGGDPLASPVAAGLLAFARTLANETSTLVVRRVALAHGLAPESAAETLRALLAVPQTETDILVSDEGARALRFLPIDRAAGGGKVESTGASRLERGSSGGLSGLSWRVAEAPAPGPGEVQIAVEATGLNFRDVMWAMSLLPDDILEDGYAGASLGLECAGRVSAVGSGVDRFRPGDRVVAFSPSAFSSSVAVPQSVVAPVPAGWSTEAAAGIPVAFLTAFYSLVTLGQLKRGDWVLVHGAAGGVGLAAIQIARWRGATVVATAGSPEKRGLLRALGVEHVLNSRSAAFADDLKTIRRKGVDIVLNSLSGEAMERGLSTLAPFGRFIELGKRDYVANTQIGLRPFRRNLSYFGVDVDQLLSDRDRASEIFGEVMKLFEAGEFTPLPYRVFSASETLDAFRLMQQSGHVGKILLRPPQEPAAARRSEPFTVASDRTHLVTGGFGGFGLEAARWLADRGAKHLVLVGRSGPAAADAHALVAELRARGVEVLAEACDVADEAALGALLLKVQDAMPPLAGILHGAMVLDDGLIANLTADQLSRVLRPKVEGARLLDRFLADTPLDYFVMFSSVTTFIGNPGQGAYVAANAYLEGLARLRRERGQPGLALAWGAISDVGVLARQKGLAEALSKRVGVRAMPARDALDLMAKALAETGSSPDRAVVAIGSLDWGAARRLPALGSPTFAALTRDGGVSEAAERESIDLKALMETQSPELVRKRVLEVIVEEIATVLRVPKQDVTPGKRLSETGLDSLMAIELATALQDRLGLDAPPTGSVGAMTTAGLADHIIGFVQSASTDSDMRTAQAVNERHAGTEVEAAVVSSVTRAVNAHSKGLRGLTR